MKFTNIRQVENGFEYDVQVSKEETLFLVNYAVGDLLAQGVISVNGFGDQEVDLREVSH